MIGLSKRVILIVFVLCRLLNGTNGNEENTNLADCIMEILKCLSGPILKMTIVSSPDNATLLTQVLKRTDAPVLINAVEHSLKNASDRRRQNDVVMYLNGDSGKATENTLWSRRTKFILVTHSRERATEDLARFWSLKVVNVFALMVNADVFTLYGSSPYTRRYDCSKTEAILLDQWRKGSFRSGGLHKIRDNKRIRDMNGCPMNVSAINVEPLVFLSEDDEGQVFTRGIEAQLMNAVAEKINCKLTYILSDSNIGWGWLNQAKGVVGEVFAGVSTFGFGVLAPLMDRFLNLDLVYELDTQECMTFAVPIAAGDNPSPWLNNITVEFKPWIWFLVFLSILSMTVVFWLGTDWGPMKSFSVVLSMFFGHSVGGRLRECLNCLSLMWFVQSFVILEIYRCMMGSLITVPVAYKDIETFGQLLDSDLKLTGYESTLMVIRQMEDPQMHDIAGRFVSSNMSMSDASDLMVSERSIAYIRHMTTFIYTSLTKENTRGKVIPLKECVYQYTPVFVLKQKSPLGELADEIFLRLSEFGMIKYWKSLYQDHPSLKRRREHEFYVFEMNQAAGIFAVLIFGLTVSTLAFAAEIALCKISDRKRDNLESRRRQRMSTPMLKTKLYFRGESSQRGRF